MRSHVFVLGANFLFLYFAWKFSKCWKFNVGIQYSYEQFFFRSNWKSYRVSVAEIGMADSKKFTPIPKEIRDAEMAQKFGIRSFGTSDARQE